MTRLCVTLLVAGSLVLGAACRKAPTGAAGTAAAAPGAPAAAPVPEPIKPMPAQLPDVLARVNGQDVTRIDFDRLVKNMEMSAGQPVPADRRDEVLRKALDQLVTYTVLSQEIKARNVTVTDADVEGNVKQMQAQFQTEQEFQKALAARGMTVEKLRADARIDLGINKMMEAEISTVPGPSDAQVREFYDKNPDKFTQGEAVRASHILIKAEESADAATKAKARAKAESLLKQVKAGSDFATLAKNNSDDGSKEQGGDLDFFTKETMVPPFSEAAFALKPGEVSGIVTTQFGYHIIKVTDRRGASAAPFEQVAPRVRDFLAQQHKQEKAQSIIDGLKKKAKIEVLI